MVSDDIIFNQGEGQDFILEIPAGALSPIHDALLFSQDNGYTHEIPGGEGGDNIFIMSE